MIDDEKTEKTNYDERLWRRRDPEIQRMFDRIEFYLADKRALFNTAYYDTLVKQWLEYGALNEKQKACLKDILERYVYAR